ELERTHVISEMTAGASLEPCISPKRSRSPAGMPLGFWHAVDPGIGWFEWLQDASAISRRLAKNFIIVG
ncbi:hypothetical protein K7B09_12595, partial [Thermomonas sp. RSS23]